MSHLRFFDCYLRVGCAGIARPEHVLDADGLVAEMDDAGIERAPV